MLKRRMGMRKPRVESLELRGVDAGRIGLLVGPRPQPLSHDAEIFDLFHAEPSTMTGDVTVRLLYWRYRGA